MGLSVAMMNDSIINDLETKVTVHLEVHDDNIEVNKFVTLLNILFPFPQ